jgi:hypothetical protein
MFFQLLLLIFPGKTGTIKGGGTAKYHRFYGNPRAVC